MADISMEIILKMLFLILNIINIKFANKKLTWKSYIAIKVLLTIKQIELIDKKKSVKLALNKKSETFMIYVLALKIPEKIINLSQLASNY